MGLFDKIGEVLFGQADPSPGQLRIHTGAPGVSDALSKLLLERMSMPATDTREFALGRAAMRESLGEASLDARRRIAASGIPLSEGQRLSLDRDIHRGEVQAFGSGLRELILGLEDRRTRDALPFLQMATGELLGSGRLQQGAETANMGMGMGLFDTLLGTGVGMYQDRKNRDVAGARALLRALSGTD